MLKGSKANILRIMKAADDIDVDEGRLSYFRYHEVLRNLADFYDVPFPAAVAVFASLSPNSDYVGNLRSTATVIRAHLDGIDSDLVAVSSYLHCRDRAFGYLRGVDFMATVGGKKIRSFYQNIINPMDPAPVTIDGHAVNIWRGSRSNLKDVAHLRFSYEAIAADFRGVARTVGLLPNQVQAITWFTWKRIHRILTPPRQLELYRDVSGDFWRTLNDPRHITTYPYFDDPRPSTIRPGGILDPKTQNGRHETETRPRKAAEKQKQLWRGRR